jgi:pimeloyl-ACP methyl ester carboxylesterase
MAAKESMIFIHGLWMSGAESRWLRRRLEARYGFETATFGYRTVNESLPTVLDRLQQAVADLNAERLHVIGHSLGGLIGYRFFQRSNDVPPGRVVFLGSPLCGSQAARGLDRFGFGRRMIGQPAKDELLCDELRRWSVDRPLGVIAGSRPVGLGRLFAGFQEPNDGTVAVRETRIEGATDQLVLPVSHLGMLMSTRVADECGRFLSDGRFSLGGR